MTWMEDFKPPYPKPHRNKASLLRGLWSGRKSWLHVLAERSYAMKMGAMKLPGLRFYVVNQEELVERILKTEHEHFPKHHLLGDVMQPLLGESIFTTNGETWKRQRKMMDGAFVNKRLKMVFPLMSDAVARMVDRFYAYGEGVEIDIDVEMTHVTADIIFRTIMSHPLDADAAKEIYEAFNEFQARVLKTMLLISYRLPTFYQRWQSERAARRIRGLLAPIIRTRYDAYVTGDQVDEHNDILASLLEARDEKTGEAFGYDELVDHVSMLFLAGHETSASALTWSLYLIASCPHTQKSLQDELADLGDRRLEFADLKELKVTRNVFREALRLYPPVGFFLREPSVPVCMRDKSVEPGDGLMVAPWLIHRHRTQWKDPDTFRPERFDDPESKKSIQCSYIPFGAGPRICIGAGFAQQESLLVLANLVRNFELSVAPGYVAEPVGRVTVRPKESVKLIAKHRQTGASQQEDIKRAASV